MAERQAFKVCEAEENTCKREVQALCYHCSKNVCRFHFMQHAQLIEEKTRTELHSLTDKFNQLSVRFNDLLISDDILQKPFARLEEWRIEAHKKIDQIVTNKQRELHDELEKYRKVFLTNKEEQLAKLNLSKKSLAELIKECDASATQIADLRKSIDDIEKYLNALNACRINVIAQPVNWSIDICTDQSSGQSTFTDTIREFKITYVRLNGIIRNYYVKTKEDGKIIDLVNSFVRRYASIEEFTQRETDQIYNVDNLPKSDFILPIKVSNHRAHLPYRDDDTLRNILEVDLIVFYETPYSLEAQNNPYILMPCAFQKSPENQPFGLPILLSVPRRGCRGTDVRAALRDTLHNFYRSESIFVRPPYDLYLEYIVNQERKKTKLDDALQDEIDFTKRNVTLLVEFNSRFVDTNEWSYYRQLHF